MEFDFNDEQREIKSTARDFIACRFKPEKVRELAEADEPYDDALWKEMCDLGWPGIAISEEHGGQGLGVVELVILQEELGYALRALADDLQRLRRGDHRVRRLRRAEGEVAAGDRLRRAARRGRDAVRPRAGRRRRRRRGGAGHGGGGGAKLVEPGDAELDQAGPDRRHPRLLPRRSPRAASRLPGEIDHAGTRRPASRSRPSWSASAQRALDMAVEYAKEREQFERPIGAYQAVSHRLADMLWAVEEARSLTYYAAWVADAEPESLELASSMAKARASDAACSVTHDAIQVFGGIGFTWEHDVHFLLKRARVGAQLMGSPGAHRAAVADAAFA